MTAGSVNTKPAVEVLVIGGGVGGALSCLTLAQGGRSVVCLEQGTWTRPELRPHYRASWEWERATSWSMSPNVRGWSSDYPIDTEDENTMMWNAVGGGSSIWTAAFPRFRPSDFRKGTEHGYQPDWPYSYEDLEPWFDAHDVLAGVSGIAGDPAFPPRSATQCPPLRPGPLAKIAARGFDRLGWHYWPTDVAIISEDYDGRPACNCCGACQSGCPTGAMYDSGVAVWPKALAAGAELRTNARVAKIETDRNGRATGATYIDRATGQRWFQPADTVIVAANGVGTARLLLLSADERHPNGLANSSGQVGRNLMHHGLAILDAWTHEHTDIHMGNLSSVYICEEFAETDPARGFINGFTFQFVRHNAAGYQANGGHSGNVAPWGEHHHRWFRSHFSHGFSIFIVGDDLPLPDNRVTLSTDKVDTDGLPAAKIDYHLCPNDRRQMDYAIERAKELAWACGAVEVVANDHTKERGASGIPAFHLLGTCRMGTDPANSVVDEWHRAWDVPNLYIMDGSVMPTGGAVNPTSTIGAMVLRAASHLRDQLAGA